MNDSPSDWFAEPASPPDDEVLYVDVAGYEGPLDLLLDLARRQKVDLARISVLALAEQYLAFIETIREKRMEIAADYLVMAAWLAYLKSRLMVPAADTGDEPTGEMMAALLQFRLKRLEAMRQAAAQLMSRPRSGSPHICPRASRADRGQPPPPVGSQPLRAAEGLCHQRERGIPVDYTPRERTVWSLQEARDILQRLIGENMDWVPLDTYLDQYLGDSEEKRTARASTFASSLELVRQGHVELRQTLAFGPLFMRRRQADQPREN